MLATNAPFPQYFDLDGKPLESGSLYFGVAGQNPETNPIAVYWDVAGTQPAAQPIPTSNGYTVRSGTPAVVYASGDYSLSVRDSKSKLCYYASSSANFSNDTALAQLRTDLASSASSSVGTGLISWLRAAASAVASTLYKWLGWQRVDVFEFMTAAQQADALAGTLLVDCSSAFQAAINSIGTTGCIKLQAGANYRIDVQLSVGSRNIVFEGDNAIVTLCSNQTYLFDVSGTNCEFRNLSVNKKTGVVATAAFRVTGLQHVFNNITSRDQKWGRLFYCQDLKESHFSKIRCDLDVAGKTGDIFYFDYCVNNTWSQCFMGFCARAFYGTATANPSNGNTNQGFSLDNVITVYAGKAVTFDRGTAITVGSGCILDFCETWGVFCTNGDDLTVAPGVWIAGNVTNGFIGVGTGAAFTNAKVNGANITRGATAIAGSVAFSLAGPRAIVSSNHIAGGMDGGTVTDGTSRVFGNTVESPGTLITTPGGNQGVADSGSWTPAINFGGAAVGVTYTTAAGTYQKVGNEVTARCRITLSSKGASVGAFQLTGLPFTNNATYNGSAIVINPSSMATQCSPIGQVQKSAAAAVFFNLAVTALIDNTYFNNNSTFDCEFHYQVA
jgi:hypothetical protein